MPASRIKGTPETQNFYKRLAALQIVHINRATFECFHGRIPRKSGFVIPWVPEVFLLLRREFSVL